MQGRTRALLAGEIVSAFTDHFITTVRQRSCFAQRKVFIILLPVYGWQTGSSSFSSAPVLLVLDDRKDRPSLGAGITAVLQMCSSPMIRELAHKCGKSTAHRMQLLC